MAKQPEQAQQKSEEKPEAKPEAKASETAKQPEQTQQKSSVEAEFVVECNCPTPLRQKKLRVKAASEQEALNKYFAYNGISGSDHKIEVTPVE